MSRKTKMVLRWLLLLVATTAITSLIGQKSDGFKTNPFDKEDTVEVEDENADANEDETNTDAE